MVLNAEGMQTGVPNTTICIYFMASNTHNGLFSLSKNQNRASQCRVRVLPQLYRDQGCGFRGSGSHRQSTSCVRQRRGHGHAELWPLTRRQFVLKLPCLVFTVKKVGEACWLDKACPINAGCKAWKCECNLPAQKNDKGLCNSTWLPLVVGLPGYTNRRP